MQVLVVSVPLLLLSNNLKKVFDLSWNTFSLFLLSLLKITYPDTEPILNTFSPILTLPLIFPPNQVVGITILIWYLLPNARAFL